MSTRMNMEALEGRTLMSASLGAFGAIGDSYTDEYQFYAPDRSTARNYVEQLVEDRNLSFGQFSREFRDAPRNQGFANNWAQSADATTDLDPNGQTAGLAAQAADGSVATAFVFAGGNDFRRVFTSPDPVAALGTVVPTALSNLLTSVNTLLAASPSLKVVLATVPKVSVLPEVRGAIAAGLLPQALADAVDFAIGIFNEQLRTIASSSNRIALADVDHLVTDIFSRKKLKVGPVTINRESASNAPKSLFLSDGIHAGTIGQALLANVFVRAMNEEFGTHIKPLNPHEILQNAGLANPDARVHHAPNSFGAFQSAVQVKTCDVWELAAQGDWDE